MNFSFLSGWWKSIPLPFLPFLIVFIAHCRGETPWSGSTTPRVTEPRLSGFDVWRPCTKTVPGDHIVETADCGPSNPPKDLVSLRVNECDDAMTTETDAVQVLAYVPWCTDAAVEKLEVLAKERPAAQVLSDLSAAYYIRAQRKDQPSDFVRSLAAADQSVALVPTLPQARFNRALAQEALGFSADAIDAWAALGKDAPHAWGREATEHHEQLISKRSRAAARKWALNKKLLITAATAGDRAAVKQLVAPYPTSAQRYLEEEVLPAWADASPENAAEQFKLAEMMAAAVAEVTGDRYLLDQIEPIRRGHDLEQLKAGHRAFGTARALQRKSPLESATAYGQATLALSRAGSSLRFEAMLGKAAALTMAKNYDETTTLIRAAEREAQQRNYPTLLARARSARAYLLMSQQYDLDALAEYSEAQAIFERVHDAENAESLQTIIIGLFRNIGHVNYMWRAAFQAQRRAEDLVEAQSRHVYLGECAMSALALGYPSIALRYQDLAVRMLEDEMSRTDDPAPLSGMRLNLGIALRARAGIQIQLDNPGAAEMDLARATPLMADERAKNIPIAFRARLAEIDAQRLAKKDRQQAIAKLSEAILLANRTYFQTLTASLHLQRAELFRLEGNRPATAEDLKSAIAILRAEEKAALSHVRKPASLPDERLWSAYFSRGQEAYRHLIRLYVEDGADADAYAYAEKARGYEPLHLILQRDDVPPSFRNRIQDGEPLRLADVEEIVPDDTVLLQYNVQNDLTYVWIIGKGFSERRTLRVRENAIRDWTRRLQRFAAARDDGQFNAALIAPFNDLFAEPLAIINNRRPPHAKLVIVPDGPMHGLPFSALRNGDRYLVQDHSVSVAASATLYAFSLAQDAQLSRPMEQSVLLFADPTFNSRLGVADKLDSLKAARDEVARIRSIYSGVANVPPPLMDDRATAPAFLRLAAGSTIVHLAVHGVANPEVPSRSFLLLAPAGEDDSGMIDAERLTKQLHLHQTRLAVLSACSSAGGIPVGPEGLAPLVRPFVVSGVPGVIGTLWNVSDSTATVNLLALFHQHYRDGHDAAESLRMAQTAMLANQFKANNAAWAWSAFQMYGSASSPFPAPAGESRKRP